MFTPLPVWSMEEAGARTDLPLKVLANALEALDFLPEILETPFALRLALLVALGLELMLFVVVARDEDLPLGLWIEEPMRLLGSFSCTECDITAF